MSSPEPISRQSWRLVENTEHCLDNPIGQKIQKDRDAFLSRYRMAASLETASILVPIAVSMGISCFNFGVRQLAKIQKICLVLPKKCGKSHLCRHLAGNEKIVLVDTDEFGKAFSSPDKRELLEVVRADKTLYAAMSHSVYDKAYDYVRDLCKKDKSKKAIFLTSDINWAMGRFKTDAIFCLVPSSEFIRSLEMSPEEKEELEHSRAYILHKLPAQAVKVYSGYSDLEALIRVRFDIQPSL